MSRTAEERIAKYLEKSREPTQADSRDVGLDVYFSADVETDGSIPGIYSMLSFALVYSGSFDGSKFTRPASYEQYLYKELKPISSNFDPAALRVNGLDRDRLSVFGESPASAMSHAARWVREIAGRGRPVLVAYPLSFDWSWLYWYFMFFSSTESPFDHSSCFDIKTAFALKAGIPIARAGRSRLLEFLRAEEAHTHNALDDAVEQAQIFANVFEWKGAHGGTP